MSVEHRETAASAVRANARRVGHGIPKRRGRSEALACCMRLFGGTAGKPPRCLSNPRRHFVGLRRDRCFAAAVRMMSLPFPLDGKGTLA